MKKRFCSPFTFAFAIPLLPTMTTAISRISYDDGGTVVRSGEDGREIEAHRNLPIYPGDSRHRAARTRRGAAVGRNIIGIDRATALRFQSMVDAYDGDNDETVAR
jgi:hypothetical protein